MKFSDLYACGRCGAVYAILVNNGNCQAVVSVRTSYVGMSAGVSSVVMCGGTIRPINWKPPEKDPRQKDIEEEIKYDGSMKLMPHPPEMPSSLEGIRAANGGRAPWDCPHCGVGLPNHAVGCPTLKR